MATKKNPVVIAGPKGKHLSPRKAIVSARKKIAIGIGNAKLDGKANGVSAAQLSPKVGCSSAKQISSPGIPGLAKVTLADGFSADVSKSHVVDDPGYELIVGKEKEKDKDEGSSDRFDTEAEKLEAQRCQSPGTRHRHRSPVQRPKADRSLEREKTRKDATRRRRAIMAVVTVGAFAIGVFFGMGIHYYICKATVV